MWETGKQSICITDDYLATSQQSLLFPSSHSIWKHYVLQPSSSPSALNSWWSMGWVDRQIFRAFRSLLYLGIALSNIEGLWVWEGSWLIRAKTFCIICSSGSCHEMLSYCFADLCWQIKFSVIFAAKFTPFLYSLPPEDRTGSHLKQTKIFYTLK